MATTTATVALTTAPDGTRYSAEDPDLPHIPASLTKIVTAFVARAWVSNLDAAVTVQVLGGGSSGGFQNGDVTTWRDLLHAMMIESDNDAAYTVAAEVGALILAAESGAGSATTRFYTEMENHTAAVLGWTGHDFHDASGLSPLNRASMAQWCQLLHHLDETDPWLVGVMGTLTYSTSISRGGSSVSKTWTHTIDPDGAVALPGFVAGKTGTVGTTAGVAILWDNPNDGARYATALHGSTSADRFADLPALMDERVAGTTPVDPPDPDPSPSGLFRTSGATVTLASADGTPVTLA